MSVERLFEPGDAPRGRTPVPIAEGPLHPLPVRAMTTPVPPWALTKNPALTTLMIARPLASARIFGGICFSGMLRKRSTIDVAWLTSP